MTFEPKEKPEKFSLPLFLMDNIIVFGASFIMVFILPLLLVSRRRSNGLIDKVLPLYNQRSETLGLELFSAVIGLGVAIVFCILKLNKFHNYKMRLENGSLEVSYINLRGQTTIEKFDLTKNELVVKHILETQENDEIIEISVRNGTQVLSTAKSRYWDNKKDKKTIERLVEEINTWQSKTLNSPSSQ
jgi:hypothetical protein